LKETAGIHQQMLLATYDPPAGRPYPTWSPRTGRSDALTIQNRCRVGRLPYRDRAPATPLRQQFIETKPARSDSMAEFPRNPQERPPCFRLDCLIIGMLGDEETTTDELDFVVRPLIRCAQQMGRNFIWHRMKSAMNDSDWLADGVNDLLSSKLAASNGDVCDRFFLAR
jgi:hypothetical protein